MDFPLASYNSHQSVKVESRLAKAWTDETTVDYWRHQRMYLQLDALLTCYPKANWLTIGDGRYGTDARYLSKFGVNVVPSDINDTYLKQAKDEGIIPHYKVENAESLSFRDGEFDFVLCKESYHHFPRPALALYEILRVAEKGVVLIEPNDQAILEPRHAGIYSSFMWFQFSVRQWAKNKLRNKSNLSTDRYETVGNYVYSISKREIEKVALGLNLEAIAVKGMNDYYTEGVEYEHIGENGPLFRTVKENIRMLDKVSARRPESFGLLIAMIFKSLPSPECINLLRKNQFDVTLLEKNPYIKS